jgi:putative FmdB family regulatory protein
VPTYEYQCDKCNQNFEVFQKFSDKPLRRHVDCGGKLEKVFHPRGVVFKGSGFYVTDSRSKGNGGSESKPADTKKSNGADKSAASSTSDKATVSSDTSTD